MTEGADDIAEQKRQKRYRVKKRILSKVVVDEEKKWRLLPQPHPGSASSEQKVVNNEAKSN